MNRKILLVATVDEAYHQLLLESQGYAVTKASMREAHQYLHQEDYDLVLVTPEDTAENSISFCKQVRGTHPKPRTVMIARRAEYVPANDWVDMVIREQSTPGKFLAAIRKTIEVPTEKGLAAPFPENDEYA